MDYDKVDWRKNGGVAILDFWNCDYLLHPYSIEFTIVDFNCNGTDLNCENDKIFDGPFSIDFNKRFPPLNEITSVDYNADEQLLILNGEDYKVESSNICYFVGDFQASEKQAIGNLLKHISEYLSSSL